MTIGPAPMIRMLWISVRFGIVISLPGDDNAGGAA
jgi:hypothetical protein